MINKQVKQKLEEVQDLLDESRNSNTRNHDNYNNLDTKSAFYFTLTSTILLVYIQYIAFPKGCILRLIFFTTISILILALVLLIIAYNPTKYQSIDVTRLINKYNDGKYKNRLKLLQKLAGTISDNTDNIKKINAFKAKLILIASWLVFSSIILITILVLSGGILNV